MHSIARRCGLDDAAAQDAFQDVCVQLWKHLERLEHVDRLASWIGTTTRRVAWKRRKQARTRTGHESAAARKDTIDEAGPREFDEEQALREALAELGTRCRELLSLLYFQSSDLSYDDIAARLGVPRGSLGPTRSRCLDTLRTALAARGVAPDVSESAPAPSAPVRGGSRPRKSRP